MRHPVVDDAAPLLALTNLSTVSFHRWPSRSDRPDRPDVLIVDLDPTSDDFDEVRRAARWTRQVLDELDLAAYLQVTGSRGVHVVTPLDRSATTDGVAAFASGVARPSWPPAIPARPRSRAARRPEGDGSTSTSPATAGRRPLLRLTRCGPGQVRRWPRPSPGICCSTTPTCARTAGPSPRSPAAPGPRRPLGGNGPPRPLAGAAGRPARRPARQRRSGRGRRAERSRVIRARARRGRRSAGHGPLTGSGPPGGRLRARPPRGGRRQLEPVAHPAVGLRREGRGAVAERRVTHDELTNAVAVEVGAREPGDELERGAEQRRRLVEPDRVSAARAGRARRSRRRRCRPRG